MEKGCQQIERLFRTWVELSPDKELLALLALLQRDLGRRGYHVTLEIARATDRAKGAGTPGPEPRR